MNYEVFKDGVRVLSFSKAPGHLLSTATRPRGFAPPAHPFLNAQAHDASVESELGDLAQRARSADEFEALLVEHGYEVRQAGGGAR